MNPIRVPGCGRSPAKIMFVGESPGKDEEEQGIPFVGASGRLFNRVLDRVGIDRSETYVTNVIWERPPNNDLDKFLVPKKSLPQHYMYPPVKKGQYLDPRFLSEIPRLAREIREVNPNIIVAFGNLSCWALFAKTGIRDLRGFVAACSLVPGKKVIPTYHPAYVLRVWKENFTLHQDLCKAKRQAEFPGIRYPSRKIGIEPNPSDILNYIDSIRSAPLLAADIETEDDIITCISFAASPDFALVIPFKDHRLIHGNYWPSLEEELYVWSLVQEILLLPSIKLFQNGVYDLQFLHRMGLRVRNATADSMLLHHTNYQELQKGLGFMGSYLTEESGWKVVHKRAGEEKEEGEE
jgi:uracil-DNA glycosylase